MSQNIENQQITPVKYTVLMLTERQNERKKAFDRSPQFGCSRVFVHSLVRRFEQTTISIDAQDRSDTDTIPSRINVFY